MQTINKPQAIKFLQDYCYAMYLGIAGLCLASIWGLIIFGSIGYGFDRYYTWWKREKLGQWQQDPDKRTIKMEVILWLAIVFIVPMLYTWLITVLPDSFFNDLWQPFTEPVVNRVAAIIPKIKAYIISMDNSGYSRNFYAMSQMMLSSLVTIWLTAIIASPLFIHSIIYTVKYRPDNIAKNNQLSLIIYEVISLIGVLCLSFFGLFNSGSAPSISWGAIPRNYESKPPI